MTIKKQVNAILSKKMDRQDFLKHVGIGIVAVSGASTALRLLGAKQENVAAKDNGYGASAYGGAQKSTS
tara:strand:- start:5636 stop:5842 length:207 start_codon:yes stop_codon:yes gene_type:complete